MIVLLSLTISRSLRYIREHGEQDGTSQHGPASAAQDTARHDRWLGNLTGFHPGDDGTPLESAATWVTDQAPLVCPVWGEAEGMAALSILSLGDFLLRAVGDGFRLLVVFTIVLVYIQVLAITRRG